MRIVRCSRNQSLNHFIGGSAIVDSCLSQCEVRSIVELARDIITSKLIVCKSIVTPRKKWLVHSALKLLCLPMIGPKRCG